MNQVDREITESPRLKSRHFLILLSTLFATSAHAGPHCLLVQVPRVFNGEKMLPAGKQILRIEGNRIASVGTEAKNTACEVFDVPDSTLGPGLIDAHTHLLLADRHKAADFSREVLESSWEKKSSRLRFGKENARSMLKSGFTALRDLGNSGPSWDLKLRREIEKEPDRYPRLFLSGPGLVAGEGQFEKGTPAKIVAHEYLAIKTKKEAAAGVRERKKKGFDWVKVYADNEPNPGALPFEILQAVVREAREAGLPVAAHSTNARSAALAVRAGVSSLEHGYDLDEATLRAMRERGIYLVPTDNDREICDRLADRVPKAPLTCDAEKKKRSDRLRAALKAGVPIAFGSDQYFVFDRDSIPRGRLALHALFALVEEGLQPVDAWRAATSSAADLLGRKDFGRIGPGKLADLVVYRGDPSKNIRDLERPVLIVKNGRLFCRGEKECR